MSASERLTARAKSVAELLEDNTNAIIEFDTAVLDLVAWKHATPRTSHGHEKEDSVSRDRKFEIFAIMVGHDLCKQNELVSDQDIPISPTILKRFVVPKGVRKRVLSSLMRSKLIPPSGKTWDQFVVSAEQ